MDAEAEINAVQAESVALQAVVIALSRQILEARPELAPLSVRRSRTPSG